MLTEDEEGAGGGDGGEVDEGGAEVEAPGLVEEAVCGGVVDAGGEEVGEERGREEQVEEDDEEPDVSLSRGALDEEGAEASARSQQRWRWRCGAEGGTSAAALRRRAPTEASGTGGGRAADVLREARRSR